MERSYYVHIVQIQWPKYFHIHLSIDNSIEKISLFASSRILEAIRTLNQLLKLWNQIMLPLLVTNCKFWQVNYSVLRFLFFSFVYVLPLNRICVHDNSMIISILIFDFWSKSEQLLQKNLVRMHTNEGA